MAETDATRRAEAPKPVDIADVGFMDRARALGPQIRRGYLQIFGIPDYERYLAHRALHHPGAPVLSRRSFSAQAIERKYRGNGPRCC